MNVTWKSAEYGREADLIRLNNERNNPERSPFARRMADKAYNGIVEQLKDHKLMSMRERLLRATKASDQTAIAKIELQIRDYLKQDKFAATGAKDY